MSTFKQIKFFLVGNILLEGNDSDLLCGYVFDGKAVFAHNVAATILRKTQKLMCNI